MMKSFLGLSSESCRCFAVVMAKSVPQFKVRDLEDSSRYFFINPKQKQKGANIRKKDND